MEAPDYRFLDLAGSHADLGYELGSQDPPFKMQPWWAAPASLHFTNECLTVLNEVAPALVEENKAYAEAQRHHFAPFWQQCCRVDLKARIRVQAGFTPSNDAEGCSTFAWRVGPHMLIGRNYDYWPQQTRRQRIRFTSANGENSFYASLGARGGVPAGRYDGINQHGVFISLHVVMTHTPHETEIKPGIPFHLITRLVLENCATARQALDWLLYIPHLSSLNYLVADSQEAFVIEADPRAVRLREAGNACIAATNHFTHPDLLPFQGRRVTRNSECRLAFLAQPQVSFNPLTTQTLLDMAEQIMADRTIPICGRSGALSTLWSCVAELATRQVRYAPGQPGLVPFQTMPL
ncbi:MAG: C45 family peptidase [Chloroflexota bacterium]|jgi:predicted choloylglycine hydrolase|nr:hypothetical protein [Chloroflexota bacterium]